MENTNKKEADLIDEIENQLQVTRELLEKLRSDYGVDAHSHIITLDEFNRKPSRIIYKR